MSETRISDRAGNEIALTEPTVDNFRVSLSGTVLRPGDSSYDEACTVWNAMVTQRPALIARCLNTPDVVAAVNFARSHNLLVSVKSGGHNIAGRLWSILRPVG